MLLQADRYFFQSFSIRSHHPNTAKPATASGYHSQGGMFIPRSPRTIIAVTTQPATATIGGWDMTKARRRSNVPITTVATVPGLLCGTVAPSAKQVTIAMSSIVLQTLTRKSFSCLRVRALVVQTVEQVCPGSIKSTMALTPSYAPIASGSR